MITEMDLQEAIAECLGERNPNANTCIKLAAYYTIRNELFGKPDQVTKSPFFSQIGDNAFVNQKAFSGDFVNQNGYSYAAAPEPAENTIQYSSDTDFGRALSGRKAEDVWPIIDDLATALQVYNPRLYDHFMRKLKDVTR